ncbi:hypothetical protein M3E10_02770 [Dietzia cinnamea]|uniref:Uncharacterized protein n=1 Tax=Dietzia cinnamea TaxID=321318 RepID=A0AAW5QAY6_9ACTN|nr:hypothetical protein [Dietzia cinnamea]MCT2034994.1 hypothetical protein [Dietzia cinnamea]MCT2108711.1 hypothetical protein [Dietzia cinnamea]MCT2119373.1 hypothetical protein [Dietzia cinnamea]
MATKTDSRSQTARARARKAMADELERARKRESKLVAVFSAIDARADTEAALGEALIELKDLGVAQGDLVEMTGLAAREVAAAIRAAKDLTATGDSTPDTDDQHAPDTTPDGDRAESH